MAYFDTDELLAAALAQLGREQGDIASEPYRGGASMEEIGTYTGGAEVVPLELAVGKRGFSSPKADKQWEIDKYFENIRRLRERGILPTPKAEANDSYLNDEIAFFASPNPGPAPVRPGEVPTDPSSPYAPWKKSPHLANLSDYRRRWLDHTSGKDVISDPIYRKNLQDIILYPDRFGFGNIRV